MPVRGLLTVLPLVLAVLAGCLAADETLPPDLEGADPAELLADIPSMDFDVTAAVDWWERIATDYPKHDANLPTNAMLRDHLAMELERIGFDVEVRRYPGAYQGVDFPSGPLDYYVVIGTRAGTVMPDHRIGLVSHYDTQSATVMGAYDDASGVAAEFAICEQLAHVETRRTVTCIFFDGEERGLVASDRYVQDVVVEGDEDYVYDFVLGYDMTGINWPGHEWKMYVMTGGADYVPVLQPFGKEVLHGVLGYPEDGVEVLDTHDRNSDERRFRDAGVPIYRFAGGRHASDYPQYHMPLDTVEYVYQYVGGREHFEAGFATIVEGSYHLVLALDGTDLDAMTARYG